MFKRRRVKSGGRWVLVAALAVTLGGCGGDSAEQAAPETAPNVVQGGAPGQPSRTLSAEELAEFDAPRYTEADVSFMQRMIHHHAQALRMTALVPKRASSSRIPVMAERMDLSQVGEIEQMQQWLEDREQPAPLLHRRHGHAHGVGQGMMPGMLSAGQLARLERADGRAFDRMFLHSMIRHHQGALTMVDQLYAAGGGQESEADAFARHVVADQSIEIARMQALLAELR